MTANDTKNAASPRGKEIERKFLVCGQSWRSLGTPVYYCQGYLSSNPARTVRVRIAGNKAFLTVKGANKGAVRTEYEYEIPVEDARVMLETLCERPLIEKTRTKIAYGRRIWEVDAFAGETKDSSLPRWSLRMKTPRSKSPTGWVKRSPATRATTTRIWWRTRIQAGRTESYR